MAAWHSRPVETLRSDRPELFEAPFAYQLESISMGNAPGFAWETEGALYIWDGRYGHYLWSAEPTPAFEALVRNEIVPAALGGGFDLAKVHTLGGAAFPLPGETLPRVRFATSQSVNAPSGEGKLKPIVATTLESFPEVLEEVELMWGSDSAFLAKGFGFIVQLQDICASWCTAEYRTREACGVGIATDPSFLRQGFGMRVGAALVNRAVKEDLRVYWDAWARNEASVGLARKLGFSDPQEYSVVLANLV
jgi:GNAT superfamily N-acetyltransferase